MPDRQFIQLSRCLFLVATLLVLTGCEKAPNSTPAESASTGSSETATTSTEEDVQLTILFNGRADDKTVSVPCSGESSVFSILEVASNAGDITFDSSGEGETAFVKSIDDVENERAAGDNWVYLVNDKPGDKGSGVYEVKPGDQVTWRFGKYEPEE